MSYKEAYICRNCGYVGLPITITPGSFGIELLLWIAFLIPGIIYSIWRLTARYKGCPQCKSRDSMIPITSSLGAKLLKETAPENKE